MGSDTRPPRPGRRFAPARFPTLALALVLALVVGAGCGDRPLKPAPVVVVAVDGADWGVIRELWGQGRLPHFASLAERGSSATLLTNSGASPVIWSTVATGVLPDRHGIRGFVVPTEAGDVPVSSAMRRVPAIWNMASAAGRRVAVLGWWVTWPAEEINGIMVSDRALLGLEREIHPPERREELLALLEDPERPEFGFREDEAYELRDRLTALAAPLLVAEGHDLILAYFRSVDAASHRYWRYFKPEGFAAPEPDELARYASRIPDAYDAVDRALGRLIEAAGPEVTLFVVSDHGFEPKQREEIQVGLNLDTVLDRLGLLVRSDGGVDFARSRVYTYDTGLHQPVKKVRYALAGREPGGTVAEADRATVRRDLVRALERVRFDNGTSAFRVRDPEPGERRRGADLIVETLTAGATDTLTLDGEPLDQGIAWYRRLSGGHDEDTHGILIAAGPEVRQGVDLTGIRIQDVTPTLLFALGLPVAEDFDGRPWTRLFSAEFQRRHPLATIATWGGREDGEAVASEVDEKIRAELRALGYLD